MITNAVNSHNCLIVDEKLHSLFIFFNGKQYAVIFFNGRQYAVSIRKISSDQIENFFREWLKVVKIEDKDQTAEQISKQEFI